MSTSLTVYVAYHDSRPHPGAGDAPYVAVCNVRADGSHPPGFPAYDDDGGFPERNTSYCELSVLRRLETRAQSPYVGLVHYRRVLLARRPRAPRVAGPSGYQLATWSWGDVSSHGAGESDLLTALGDRDWCTPEPYDVRRAGFRSLWEQFHANHPAGLLDAADVAVTRQHPRLPSLRQHLRSTHATPLYNVFLGRREILERYAAFLWPILDDCAQRLPQEGDAYQGRWAGFLAERLHGYWLEHVARPDGLRIGTLPLGVLRVGGIQGSGGGPLPAGAAPGETTPAGLRRVVDRLPAPLLLRLHQLNARRQRPRRTVN